MDDDSSKNNRGHCIYDVFLDIEKVSRNKEYKAIGDTLKNVGIDSKITKEIDNYLNDLNNTDRGKLSGFESSNPKLTGITTSIIRMDKVKDEPISQDDQLKKINHKIIKNEGLFDVARDIRIKNLKYFHFIPLHNFWKQYILGLTEIGHKNNNLRLSQLSQYISQADLHGSIITVISSRNKSYVNVEGIVVKETKETFVLISKDNKVRTIVKNQSIFSIQILNYFITLYGSQLRYHPCERIKHKFRHKDSLDII